PLPLQTHAAGLAPAAWVLAPGPAARGSAGATGRDLRSPGKRSAPGAGNPGHASRRVAPIPDAAFGLIRATPLMSRRTCVAQVSEAHPGPGIPVTRRGDWRPSPDAALGLIRATLL